MREQVPMHGGQLRQIAKEFEIPIAQLLDFSANIHPDGPSDEVLVALRESLRDPATLTQYPDLELMELKRSISDYVRSSELNIVIANGFVPLLETAIQTLKIRRCLLPVPAFLEYRKTLERAGVEIEPYPLSSSADFAYQVGALLKNDNDAMLLANPQNPSGALASRELLLSLVEQAARRGVRVLLDEAFIDFTPAQSLAGEIERFHNLLVFRSVTKFHGIPGLRVAYALVHSTMAQQLRENLSPWPVSTLAANGVIAALGDRQFAREARQRNEHRRAELKLSLERLGVNVYPSAANFLLFQIPQHMDATGFWKQMICDYQIVLRTCSNYENLAPGHFRTAVRTELENARLVQAVRTILGR